MTIQMNVYRVAKLIDPPVLRRELESAFGLFSSDRFLPMIEPGEVVVIYDPAKVDASVITAVIQAHDGSTALKKSLRLYADEQETSDCCLDVTIMGLVNQTRAEWRAWAGANFQTLTAPERTKLGDLFWVVSLGVRRVVRNG